MSKSSITNSLPLVDQFSRILWQLWRESGSPSRLGLAISGGVDSMALAALCHDLQHRRPFLSPRFSGIIVDHGIREGSADEARKVGDELDRLEIEPRIVKLDRQKTMGNLASLTNLETVARKLRYRALGHACYEDGIGHLLVAHHADDQAETILSRILAGYTGAGLQGMRDEVRIPDCEGIYGVDRSGRHHLSPRCSLADQGVDMAIANGGVTLHRPLLSFTKAQLQSFCVDLGVKWFEDHTNADRTLTPRNTIRYLRKENVLPLALRPESLRALAASLREKHDGLEAQAQTLFDSLKIDLDLRKGLATVSLSGVHDSGIEQTKMSHNLKTALLRKILHLVSPVREISLQDLDKAVEVCFASSQTSTKSNTQIEIAGVSIRNTMLKPLRIRGPTAQEVTSRKTRAQQMDLVVCRMRPPRAQLQRATFMVATSRPARDDTPLIYWSEWLLWDQRYWLRVGRFADSLERLQGLSATQVGFFSAEALGALRQTLDQKERIALKRALGGTDMPVRATSPAIFAPQTQGGDVGNGPMIVALPSIGWSRQNWRQWVEGNQDEAAGQEWFWQVQYKNIDFATSKVHSLI